MRAVWMARGLLACLVSVGLMLSVGPAMARAVPIGVADLVAHLSPAVVNISTSQMINEPDDAQVPGSPFAMPPDAVPEQPEKVQSLGSGFVIDAKGIIVTNNHVIDGADTIDVTFTDGTTLPAKLLGHDDKTDIAVLKVESPKPLAFVALGDSDKLRVGDWVMAIGNPFGLGGSVTLGIVSALNRDIHAGSYDDFIQTDAAINRGNSGGPLFNLAGDVVGMNTAIISPSGESVGIGFATPASTIASIVPQIVTHGSIRRGWIGVRIQTVTQEIATSLGLQDLHGALVAGVAEGGPADKGGIETGDLITTFDGKPVPEMRDLPRIVAETEIGRMVKVGIIRSGQTRQVTLKVGLLDEPDADDAKTPDATSKAVQVEVLGMQLVVLDEVARGRFNLAGDARGALVSAVAPGSAAADKGLRPGDLIVRVGQVDVDTPQGVADAVAKDVKAGRGQVLLRVVTGGAARFVAVAVK